MRAIRPRTALLAVSLAQLAAACAFKPEPERVRVDAAPSDFHRALAGYYLEFSGYEFERYDFADSERFFARAIAAARGETGDPEPVSARDLPAARRAFLAERRAALVAALDDGAAALAHRDAADAVASFDCWIEEEEEGHQPDDIAYCRDRFERAIEAVRRGLRRTLVVLLENLDGTTGSVSVGTGSTRTALDRPLQGGIAGADGPGGAVRLDEGTVRRVFAAALDAQPIPPATILLYFETGTDRLTEDSRRLLPRALKDARRRPAVEITVIGHTDRVWSSEINERLARARAAVVAEALYALGIERQRVEVRSFGERDPLIPTADNVPEPRNRRVELSIR
ncbi:MAG: hypothetical protein FJX67_06130 [Alphaproteobacteria bacterium]|nr:hypothetical protein [Alphaproteobacteria bacterium]